MDRTSLLRLVQLVCLVSCWALPNSAMSDDLDSKPKPASRVIGNPDFKHGGYILFMKALPNGTQLVSLGYDGTIRIWDIKTHKEVKRMASPGYATLWGAQLLKDQNRLLTTADGRGALLWDLEKGELLKSYYYPTSVYRLTTTPNEALFITGSSNTKCYTWDMKTGQALHVFTEHTKDVYAVAAPDDSTILSCGEGGSLKSWNPKTGAVNWSTSPAAGDLFSLYLSHDKTTVLVCSKKQGASLREVKTGRELWSNQEMKDVRTAAWSHNGTQIALHNDTILVVDATNGKTKSSMNKAKGYPWAICWSIDDKTIFASSSNIIQEFDVESAKKTYPEADVKDTFENAKNPMLVPELNKLFVVKDQKSLDILDTESGKHLGTIALDQNIRGYAVCPKTNSLAVLTSNGYIHLIDAKNQEIIRSFKVDESYVTLGLLFSHDGTYLYTSRKGSISRWNVSTGSLETSFPAVRLPEQRLVDIWGDSIISQPKQTLDNDDDWGNDAEGWFGDDDDDSPEENLPDIEHMVMSPDDTIIAACLKDGSISLVSAVDGTLLQSLIYPMKYGGFQRCHFLNSDRLTLVASCKSRPIEKESEPTEKNADDDLGFADDDDDDDAVTVDKIPVPPPTFKRPTWTTGGLVVWQSEKPKNPLPDKQQLNTLFLQLSDDSYLARRKATSTLTACGTPVLNLLSTIKTNDPELISRILTIRSRIFKTNRLKSLPTDLAEMDILDIEPLQHDSAWAILSETSPYHSILICKLINGHIEVINTFSDTNLHSSMRVGDTQIVTINQNGTLSIFDLDETK